MQHHGLLIAHVALLVAGLAPAAAAPAGWPRHEEPQHGFSVGVPPGFVVQALPAPTRWQPAPQAVLGVMREAAAPAVREGADLPALQLRVFTIDRPLAAWLQAQPANAGATLRVQPDGAVQVCPAVMLAPGCSLYRARGAVAVQLLPLGDEGQAVAASFAWLSRP